jgi:hypothetical protein
VVSSEELRDSDGNNNEWPEVRHRPEINEVEIVEKENETDGK